MNNLVQTSRRKPRKRQKTPFWLFSVVLLIFVAFSLFSLNAWLQNNHILTEGIRTTAIVYGKDVHRGNRGAPDAYWVYYSYEIDQTRYDNKSRVPFERYSNLQAGDTLDIVYIIDAENRPKSLPAGINPTSFWNIIIPLVIGATLSFGYLYGNHRKESPGKAPFQATLPDYVPTDYEFEGIKYYKVKGIPVANLIYNETKSDGLIWIKEAQEPIPDLEPKKKMDRNRLKVNGITVNIAKSPKDNNSPLFIESDWNSGGVYFNLRTFGLEEETVNRVRTSLIK